jgi:hypothetical protein
MSSLMRDLAGIIAAVSAGPRTNATAGGANAGTTINGSTVDTSQLYSPSGANFPDRYESVVALLAVSATLGASDTVTVTALLQTSPDTVNWTTVTPSVPSANALTLTGPTGGGTVEGVIKIGTATEYCDQYVRVAYSSVFSASSTDTSDVAPVFVFGGAAEVP